MSTQLSDCLLALIQWWARVPAGCLGVTYAVVTCYLLWYLPPGFPVMLADFPYYVFYKGEGRTYSVHRLLTANFVSRDLIDCLISLYFFLTRAPRFERLQSTVKFFWEFLVIGKA
jgi:hypothetical protein